MSGTAEVTEATTEAVTDTGLQPLKRYAQLANRRRELKDELETIESELNGAAEIVLRLMEEIGLGPFTIDGLTVYLRHQIWASATDVPALAGYADTAEFVKPTVNGNTMSAWVRELPRTDEGLPILPDEIKDAVKVTEKSTVENRKAKG